MKRLKPIGSRSMADEHGYSFDLLVSWLEDIRDSELELADERPAYKKRAHKLSDLVDELSSMSEE